MFGESMEGSKGFFGSQFEVQFITAMGTQQEEGETAGHIVCGVRKQLVTNAGGPLALCVQSSRTLAIR